METRLHDIASLTGTDELLEHRAALDALDRKILALAAERAMLAGKIGLLKTSMGLDLRDREREGVVIHQALTHAGRLGLPADIAMTMMECLLEAARRRQQAELSRHL